MMSPTREAGKATAQLRAELIDEMMDRYIEWREQCAALKQTYERWTKRLDTNAKLAFEAYKAALDLEEHASIVYADRVTRFEHELVARSQRLAIANAGQAA